MPVREKVWSPVTTSEPDWSGRFFDANRTVVASEATLYWMLSFRATRREVASTWSPQPFQGAPVQSPAEGNGADGSSFALAAVQTW